MDIISQDEWILDSSRHVHICSKREYFDTFQKNTRFVSLGDESRCDVMGVGMVKIKIFDGMVHTLGGVVCVPNMQKNIISLSRLNSTECRYLATGETMKITRGCLVLMNGERCQDELYRLSGSTIISSIPLTLMGNRKRSARNSQH